MTTFGAPFATVSALPVEPVATAFAAPLAILISRSPAVQYIAPAPVVHNRCLKRNLRLHTPKTLVFWSL